MERWNNNQTTRERDQLGKDVLERAVKMFEEPTPGENYVVFNSDVNFEVWAKENIS